jgi:peptidoglycan hydrolase-like protein with peptidoglycan-binding domain
MGAAAFQFTQTPARPVFAGARISIALRAYDPDSAELSASPRLPRAMTAIGRAGYKVKYRCNDLAGLVTPSLMIDGNALVSRKSVSDVAQEMIDLLRRGGLIVSGGKATLYAPGKKRGRRAGLLVRGLLDDSDNTFADVQLDSSSVRQVQATLNRFASKLPPLVVDGIQGSKTTARLKEFQRDTGLPITGVADSLTLQALGVVGGGNDAAARAAAAAAAAASAAAVQAALDRSRSGLLPPNSSSGAALRGSVVDAVITVGQAWRVLSYTSNLKQQLIDKLNVSGFQVISVNDSNISYVTGGTLRVRAMVMTDGYSSANDAASVIRGWASDVGYNATGFSGALVSGGSNAAVPSGAVVPSSAGNAGGGGASLLGGDMGTVLLLVGGLAVGGIVLSKLVNR